MDIKLTIKNYRCFPINQPAEVTLRPGFTAYVGINNSGKSSLLRFFHEFRNVFEAILGANLRSERENRGYSIVGVADQEEVFCRNNEERIIN